MTRLRKDGMTQGSEADGLHSGSMYGSDEELIEEAVGLLAAFDNTPLDQMTPLFYQHGYEELRIITRELLRILGSAAGNTPPAPGPTD